MIILACISPLLCPHGPKAYTRVFILCLPVLGAYTWEASRLWILAMMVVAMCWVVAVERPISPGQWFSSTSTFHGTTLVPHIIHAPRAAATRGQFGPAKAIAERPETRCVRVRVHVNHGWVTGPFACRELVAKPSVWSYQALGAKGGPGMTI